MPNHIVVPGFEASGWWDYAVLSQRRQDLGSHGGSWAGFVGAEHYGLPRPVIIDGRLDTPAMAVASGQNLPLRLWLNGDNSGGNRPLRLSVDPGSGSFAEIATILTPQLSGWHLFMTAPVLTLGASARVRFDCLHPEFATIDPTGWGWLLDDVVFGAVAPTEAEMIEQIRANLFAKLEGIKTANGYQLDTAEVTMERKRITDVATPGLILVHLRGELGEGPTFTDELRHAEFLVIGVVADEDATPDIEEKLMRDVARAVALDRTLGGLESLKDRARLLSYDPHDLGEEVARGKRAFDCVIGVDYIIPAGDL